MCVVTEHRYQVLTLSELGKKNAFMTFAVIHMCNGIIISRLPSRIEAAIRCRKTPMLVVPSSPELAFFSGNLAVVASIVGWETPLCQVTAVLTGYLYKLFQCVILIYYFSY